MPVRATDCASAACIAGEQGTAEWTPIAEISTVMPRRAAMLWAAATMSAMAPSRTVSSAARTSSDNSQLPGMTLIKPCGTASWPTVPTRVGPSLQRRSTASTISAAAVAASWRSAIGTVPGVPRRAANADVKSRRAGNRGDDADRQILVQQNGPLFDMNFEIAPQRLRRPRQSCDRIAIDALLLQQPPEPPAALF